jgi:hypothetical protein
MRFISWGGGLQSTCMAVMSALGDLPKVDAVINVDPGFESQENYKSIAWYKDWLNDHGVHTEVIKSKHNIKTDYLKDHIDLPYWTETGAPLQRQCTSEYKMYPSKRRYREIAGYDPVKPPHPKPGEFEVWIGFTLDEHERRSVSRVKYMTNRWPLIELGMTRDHCTEYLQGKGLPIPPKSACVICPYRRASEWIAIRDQSPEDWREAVEIDKRIRGAKPLAQIESDKIYLWRGLEPLDEADLEAAAQADEERRKDKAHQILICDGGSCWT